MANTNFNVDIDAAAVISQYESERMTPVTTKKINFDIKNYLQAKLGPNETSKTMTIRLLPFSPEAKTPFKKVHMHTVKVNKGVSASGWKTFVCPITNKDDEGKPFGDKCPFCEVSAKAKKLLKESDNTEAMAKKYSDIEYMNRPKEMWLVRCIERGHEEDGVKFWMFPVSKKGDGVYDKINNLFNQRMKEDDYNVLSLIDGKDLVITLKKGSDGKTTVQVIDKSKPTPLSEDADQMQAWVNDQKKWQDVYTVKPYNFMEIVVNNGVPKYSKEIGGWYDSTKDETPETEEKEAEEPKGVDYSEIVNGPATTVIDGNRYQF